MADRTGVPGWVKVAGIITAALILVFVVLLLGGGHSPGRHASRTGTAPATSIAA